MEICDAIVAYDPATLERLPVSKTAVVEQFSRDGNARATAVVKALPALPDGALDPHAVDALLIRVHCEMQRMSEELQHGRRAAELLRPLIAALREQGCARIRLVDVGCGTGFVLRWLAAREDLGEDVELVGADYNRALVEQAQRLADAERLKARFVVANAFKLDQAATVILSTGVLHHFRGEALTALFAQHERAETLAFVHFDFQPSIFCVPGAWLFHAVRMREPLALHDGVLSARLAHDGPAMLAAARSGAPGFESTLFSRKLWHLPVPRAFHSIVGVRPRLREAFIRRLGARAARLEAFA